jgi:DNA-binding SARP family transcriptional activator/pimeloyl-ACP methyl ester carboxylesterase
MAVRIELLGGFTAHVDGRPVVPGAWRRRSAATLVKVLALWPEHRMHRERLVDLLWPDLDPSDAAPRLHTAAHYARKALERPDAVVLTGDVVALLPGEDVEVDVDVFEAAADAALREEDPQAARAAVRLYRGELLPEALYEPWAEDARRRVGVAYTAVLRLGGCWEELLKLEPADTEAHLALMRRHLAAGDRRSAMRQFEWLEGALARDLGDDAGAELDAVREELAQGLESIGPLSALEDTRLTQVVRFCRTTDGVDLAYATTGTGPPLVKAANWMTHLDYDWHSPVWKHWLVGLSCGHTLVRYDERGCGLSDRDVEDQTFEAWVRDLETVVDAAGLQTFPLLGISQGAAVAVTYAARHPERVSRLVLYGSYAQGRAVRARTSEDLRMHHVEIELARLGWGSDDPAFRQVFTAQFMPEASKELWEDFNELQRLSTSPENAADVLRLCGDLDVTAEARKVRCPTLVLHARRDHRPPFEQGRLLASCIPDSRFVTLESDDHILLEDEPAWPVFLAEVEGFLAT